MPGDISDLQKGADLLNTENARLSEKIVKDIGIICKLENLNCSIIQARKINLTKMDNSVKGRQHNAKSD